MKKDNTSYYSYVITHDFGFAPNPYGNILTLATSKPIITRTPKINDWLIGTGSVQKIGADKLIYCQQEARWI